MRGRTALFPMALLLGGLTTQSHAQVTGGSGDRYESYTALKACTSVNCNLSFPLFTLPNGAQGKLLVEDISCRTSSETLVWTGDFGVTNTPDNFNGTKRSFFRYFGGPYNSFSNAYSATFHATPLMLMQTGKYMTMNFYVNPKSGSTIYYTYISCSMAGKIVP